MANQNAKVLKLQRPARKRGKPRKDRAQDRQLYFAYGSNLHVEQMTRRCPSAEPIGAATLAGYRLRFRGVADIEQSHHPRARVHGALWSITPRDLAALDRYEGYPHLYIRHYVEVDTAAGPAQALVYRMTTPYRQEQGLPSPGYLQTCLDGFAAWGLPSWVMRRALKDAGRYLLAQGVTELRREGKRMVPVRPEPEPDPWDHLTVEELERLDGRFEDDEWVPVETKGMSPATRKMLGLE